MTTFAELSEPDTYSKVTQIPRENVRLLWHSGFWDGPLSGMLEYDGEHCWFEMFSENEDDEQTWYRRFVILRLSPDQLADENRWHDLFRKHVGGHTDYDSEQKRSHDTIKSKEQWSQFYDEYKARPEPDYSSNLVIGWFET
jgi:hypothetical protein